MDYLTVVDASQHNLRNVSCELPRDQLVVITGPSGSGKSSLAFDTIYAEGQRRYVESLSAYARQFLEQLPKPAVARIEGLSPAIAIEQKTIGKSPRSTVGTVTEISDYLRLLFARVGTPHCPKSGRVLRAYTVQEIVDTIIERGNNTRAVVLASMLRGHPGPVSDALERLRTDGFVRAKLNGRLIELSDDLEHEPNGPTDLEVVVDRIVVKDGIKKRLTDSVELALRVGEGTVLIDFMDGQKPAVMSEHLISWEFDITLPPLEPRLFSFNSPHGACPSCNGLGVRTIIDPERLVSDPQRSLRQGAILAFGARGSVASATEVNRAVKALGVDPDTPWAKLTTGDREQLLFGENKTKPGRKKKYEGIIPRLERMLQTGEVREGTDASEDEGAIGPGDLNPFLVTNKCNACAGSRLRPEALSVKVATRTIADLCELPLSELREFLASLSESELLGTAAQSVALPLLHAMTERLGFLIGVGLDYLCLNRSTRTLSGGEGQRIRLATQIGAALVGVLYVLDEPSIGLHAKDNHRLLTALRALVDKGNSVLMVEHDRDAILAADYMLDMGPGAGVHGGTIVARGTPAEVSRDPNSITGPYLRAERRLDPPGTRKKPNSKRISLRGASAHNLQDVDVDIPIGLITAVTGVSGSGKSSLIIDTLLNATRAHLYRSKKWVGPYREVLGLEHFDKVISIDQAPIGRTPRSNPATYTGIFTNLRELYASLPEARARGYKAGRFSFNVKGGRCENCQGDGVLRVEMHFLPDVYVTCDACKGLRYNRETLEIGYRGLSVADALELTVDAASEPFGAVPNIAQRLQALRRVGLGYLTLGQPATTLSGGEAQRLKLATELAKKATGSTLYVLDEPTTGLHFSDIELLSTALFALRDAGNTIVIIEHNLDLVACADWLLDLGPDGGTGGGQLVVAGPPEDVSQCRRGHTGRLLSQLLANHRAPQR